MRTPTDIYQERAGCPLYTAIAVIDGRWKPMMLQRLSEQALGFGELKRALPRITTKVLRQQLRQMADDDLLAREQLTPARLGVRYCVTTHGASLGPVFNELWHWGTAHLAAPGALGVPWPQARRPLDAFHKKSKRGVATPQAELEMIKRRLKRAVEISEAGV